jgi:DNA-binding NarL/FixJ family response regulator
MSIFESITETSMPINILITDDHQLILDGLKSIIREQEDMNVVAEANNGQQAITLCNTLKIDLVMMDIDMPVMNGLEATQQLKKTKPEIKVIVLTMHDEPALIRRIMEIGADGYMLKNSDQEELVEAIRKVIGGQKYFSAEVTMALAGGKGANDTFTLRPSDTVFLAQLTEREIEILRQIAEGLSNKEIGDKLFISHRTVDTHRTNLMKKLDVHNIAGLIRFAIRNGLVTS